MPQSRRPRANPGDRQLEIRQDALNRVYNDSLAGIALVTMATLKKHVFVIVVAMLAVTSSDAAWCYYYKDLPLGRMNDADLAIAIPVIRHALDEGADGQTQSWANKASGASGSVTLKSDPFTRDGMTCRRAEFMTVAGGLKNVSSWTLCKRPDGWKVVDE